MPTFVAAASQDASFDAGGTPVTFAFDAGTDADRVLIVTVGFRNNNGHSVADTGVTYNGVTLTPFGAAVILSNVYHKAFYLAGPASGSNTVSVDPSAGAGASDAIISVYCYSGVDQTTPQDGYTSGSGTDNTAELTVTSEVGDTPVYFVICRATTPTAIAPTNYTERVDNPLNALIAGGGEGTGAASVAFTGTISSAGIVAWVTLGANLNAAAGGGAVPGGYYQQYYHSLVTGVA